MVNNEEKILEILLQMQQDQREMHDDLGIVHKELGNVHKEIEGLHGEIEGLHGEIGEFWVLPYRWYAYDNHIRRWQRFFKGNAP